MTVFLKKRLNKQTIWYEKTYSKLWEVFMNKYIIVLIVAVSLMFCFVPVLATDQVIPTPPSWVEEGEYVVFENSSAYEPEVWKEICEIRGELEKEPVFSYDVYHGLLLRMAKVSPGKN